MPRRDDINKILIVGSGPIVIGQACEFDYSGTQACRALKQEGFTVILVNSNPATIMTDPEIADRTYIEPLTVEALTAIIEKERPDAVLPTVGGQTGLNLSVELYEKGVFDKYGVKLIGANIDAIKVGEDRELFKAAMDEIGIQSPKAGLLTPGKRQSRSSKRSATLRSSARASRLAEQAAARHSTRRNSKRSPAEASPLRQLRRSSSKNRSSVGKNTSLR